jgi:hypothetical protein
MFPLTGQGKLPNRQRFFLATPLGTLEMTAQDFFLLSSFFFLLSSFFFFLLFSFFFPRREGSEPAPDLIRGVGIPQKKRLLQGSSPPP